MRKKEQRKPCWEFWIGFKTTVICVLEESYLPHFLLFNILVKRHHMYTCDTNTYCMFQKYSTVYTWLIFTVFSTEPVLLLFTFKYI